MKDTEDTPRVVRCVHCGAELPTDVRFQEYHMWKVHGLVV